MDLYIVLAVTVFMMVMFVWHKVPFGLTTITCCIHPVPDRRHRPRDRVQRILEQDRHPGRAHDRARCRLRKDEHDRQDQDIMQKVKEKNGTLLVLAFFFFTALLAAFIPSTAVLAIIAIFAAQVGAKGDITPTRLILSLPRHRLVLQVPLPGERRRRELRHDQCVLRGHLH